MSYLCDLFFILLFIFIIINHVNLLKLTNILEYVLLFWDDYVKGENV